MSKYFIAALMLVLTVSLRTPSALAGAAAPSSNMHDAVHDVLIAQGAQTAGGAPTEAGPSELRMLLQWLLSLAFVVVIAYVVTYFLRRLNFGRMATRAGAVRVVETIPLGPNRAVHLVAVGARRLLIGTTAQQVTLLEDVTGQVEEVEAAPAPPPTPQTFLHHLQALTRPGRGNAPASEERPHER